MKDRLQIFIQKIQSANNIVIFAHKNLDGDAMGSVLAMGRLIELNFNKTPICLYDGKMTDYLELMPLRSRMVHINDFDVPETIDVAIVLDYGSVQNTGAAITLLDKAKYVIEVDHHSNLAPVGHLCFDDDNAAATTNIVLRMIKEAKWKTDNDILSLLALGIITDTGRLQFATTGEPAYDLGDLINAGVDLCVLMDKMNNSDPKSIQVQAKAIANAELFFDNRLAVATLCADDLQYLSGRGDLIHSTLRQIKGVEYIVLLKQRQDCVDVSMRGITKPVKPIAEVLGGGGHDLAAGAQIDGTLDIAHARVLELFEKELSQ